MTTATEQKSEHNAPTAAESSHALLFELEGLVGSARQATYEILKSILREHGIDLQPVHVSRYCLQPSPASYVEALLDGVGASRMSADKLVEDLKSGIALQLASQGQPISGPVAALLDEARTHGVPLAAMSGLPRPGAEALMESLGLNERNVKLTVVDHEDDEEHFPRADSWLKIAKSLRKNPFNCGVIATSQAALKSALSAGMHCVAIPDSFTAFEDFSGADLIIEDVADMSVEDVLMRLCPHYRD
jgi:beta-phosphoglucomutase-like phosphatase (HAD superfamily)